MFLRRLEVFDYENNEFYKPGGKYNTSSKNSKYQLPNCTHFGILRVYEMCGKAIKGVARKDTYDYGTAKNWDKETGMPKGDVPKDGSVAVFDGTSGHILIVEHAREGGHCTTTESNYSDNKNLRDWHFFNLRKDIVLKKGEAPIAGVGKILHFLYPPIDDIRTERNPNMEQVEITAEMVNCRKKPEGEVVSKGCYIAAGIYNVMSSQTVNGYVWYELEEGHWVREGWWLTHYENKNAFDEVHKKIEKLDGTIKELKEAILTAETNV